jgi:hypothetical protein|tara:strand:- start:288 stop:767 length:480 start_codon:yes stop_codon:yes gene_type:complete
MTVKKYSLIVLCTVIWCISIIALYAYKPVKAQTMMCNERTTVLESLKVNFNEELTELGVTENGIVVAFTVSPKKTWTMLMIPTAKPYSYCILVTGSAWEQKESTSTGLVTNGGLISIGIDDNSNWAMIMVDDISKQVIPLITGHAWDRLVDINIQKQAL